MSFFGFGQTADIEIAFDDADRRKVVELKNSDDGKKDKHLLYYDGETVSGKVNVTVRKPGTKLEHQGIKVELIGQIELYYDRGNHHEFISLVKELARPGDLLQHTSYSFEFANVEKPYEVYSGSNVRLRYFVRATVVRRISDVTKEVDIAVHTLCSYPDVHNSIKMEVGIEDCLHIEFEYNKSKYHLKDVIVGKIYFLLVRIKIKHMEISIIKRETTGASPNTFTENETVAKYEIMDGAPVRGESIPIRVFLAGYELTPTMRDINNKFSVRYYLNLVLMDTEDRRYFKQQEVTLWRRSDRVNAANRTVNAGNPSHLVGARQPRRSPSGPHGLDPLVGRRDSPQDDESPPDHRAMMEDERTANGALEGPLSKDNIKQFISESASTNPLDPAVRVPADVRPLPITAESDPFGASEKKIGTAKSNTEESVEIPAESEVPSRVAGEQ